MKAAVISVNGTDEVLMLLPDHTVAKATEERLKSFLLDFKEMYHMDLFKDGDQGQWDKDDPLIMKSTTFIFAYITDSDELIVYDSMPFQNAFQNKTSTLIDAREYAAKHGKSIEQIKVYCRSGRLKGARLIGKSWAIPEDTPYPEDGRMTAGGLRRRVKKA